MIIIQKFETKEPHSITSQFLKQDERKKLKITWDWRERERRERRITSIFILLMSVGFEEPTN
jgi:hypothetical protein